MKKITIAIVVIIILILFTILYMSKINQINRSKLNITTQSNEVNQIEISISNKPTKIVQYKQERVPKESKFGSCWTLSSVSSSPHAFRCDIEEWTHDPCFLTDFNKVVCGDDPFNKDGSFELKLTKSLPEERKIDNEYTYSLPWIVTFENGLVCKKYTGAAADINGKNYYYYCNVDNVVILGLIDYSSDIWKAKIAYLTNNRKLIRTEIQNIVKSWL